VDRGWGGNINRKFGGRLPGSAGQGGGTGRQQQDLASLQSPRIEPGFGGPTPCQDLILRPPDQGFEQNEKHLDPCLAAADCHSCKCYVRIRRIGGMQYRDGLGATAGIWRSDQPPFAGELGRSSAGLNLAVEHFLTMLAIGGRQRLAATLRVGHRRPKKQEQHHCDLGEGGTTHWPACAVAESGDLKPRENIVLADIA
jgi:hypothetical protein